jgi:hypothetical protein
MDDKNLRAIFSRLADCDGKTTKFSMDAPGLDLPLSFPFDKFADKSQLTNESFKKNKVTVKKKALKKILGRVLHNDPNHPDVTHEDILGLVDEISCSRKGTEDREEPFIVSIHLPTG